MLNGKTKNHLDTLWTLAGKKKKEAGVKEREIHSQPSTNPGPTKTSDKSKNRGDRIRTYGLLLPKQAL